jgi:hypothetical protein
VKFKYGLLIILIAASAVADYWLIAQETKTGSAKSADPFAGTWLLNVAKSKFNPSPGLKSGTARIEAQDNGIRCVLDPVSAEGVARHGEWAAKFDGKDYPSGMKPFADTVALKKISANTLEALFKKGEKAILGERWVLSGNHKTLTMTQKGMDSSLQGLDNTLVYEK